MTTPVGAPGPLTVVGYGLETTAGTYLSPTNWGSVESNGIVAKPDIIKKPMMGGTRYATRIVRPAKYKVGGPLGFPLSANVFAPLLKGVFGANTGLTALAADTVKAATPITTTNGISTITVTNTATVTYTQYAWLTINTGTASEARQIQTISGNGALGTILTVGALIGNAAAAAGTAVQQGAQIKFTTAPTTTTMPSFSLALEEAGAYEWRLAGCYADSLEVKGGKDVVEATLNVMGSKTPVKAAAQAPTFTAAELSDQSRPFSITDTQLVLYQDPIQSGGATGASIQQMATWVEDFSFKWKQGTLQKGTHDQSQVYRVFPGAQDCDIEYSYINASLRFSEFEDYVGSLAGTQIPISYGMALNASTTSTADWRGIGFSMPNVVLTEPDPVRQVGDVLIAKIKGDPLPPSATGDPVSCFLMNAVGATPY